MWGTEKCVKKRFFQLIDVCIDLGRRGSRGIMPPQHSGWQDSPCAPLLFSLQSIKPTITLLLPLFLTSLSIPRHYTVNQALTSGNVSILPFASSSITLPSSFLPSIPLLFSTTSISSTPVAFDCRRPERLTRVLSCLIVQSTPLNL